MDLGGKMDEGIPRDEAVPWAIWLGGLVDLIPPRPDPATTDSRDANSGERRRGSSGEGRGMAGWRGGTGDDGARRCEARKGSGEAHGRRRGERG